MLSSKIATLAQDGIEPFIVGKSNFRKKLPKVEEIAAARAITCECCRYFKTEPIPFLRVKDNNIPSLSGKSCGLCGCVLSYKTRQSIKICKRWDKQ